PARTVSETSCKAWKLPKRLLKLRSSTRGAPVSSFGGGIRLLIASTLQCSEEGAAGRDGTEDAALHRHHLQRRFMVAAIGRGGRVADDHALEAAVVGFTHRRVDADIGRHAGENEVADAARAQDQLEVGRAERSFARLVEDDFTRHRRKLVDDLPARFAAHQELAARPGVADADARVADL